MLCHVLVVRSGLSPSSPPLQVLALMAAALVQAEGASGTIMEELLRAQLEARAGGLEGSRLIESLVGSFRRPQTHQTKETGPWSEREKTHQLDPK